MRSCVKSHNSIKISSHNLSIQKFGDIHSFTVSSAQRFSEKPKFANLQGLSADKKNQLIHLFSAFTAFRMAVIITI